MKKALIIANLSGFLSKFEMNNVHILQDLGYEVHYASNTNAEVYDFRPELLRSEGVIFHNIKIARSPYMLHMNAAALRELIRIIDEEQITLIHCHTPVGGVLGRLAGALSRAKPKVIYTAHGFHFYQGEPLINNTVYKCAEFFLAHFTDVLVVINHEDYRNASKMHLKKNGRVVLIPGEGISHGKFAPVSENERLEARRRLGISENTFFILSVGELNLNKNHRVVIDAVQKILEKNRIAEPLLYAICGEGYFREEAEEYIAEHKLTGSVKLMGYQDKIRSYYAAADITAFPSVREGLGMAALESLAMGIPVIASDNRGTREYMRNGVNGYIYRADDSNGFAEGICKIYQLTGEERKRMSENCIKSTGPFDIRNTEVIMRDIYSKLNEEISYEK